MYDNLAPWAAEGTGALAATGLNFAWLILAGVAFLILGAVLLRFAPSLVRVVSARTGHGAAGYQGKHRQ